MDTLLDQLHLEPALAWKVAVNLLGHAPDSAKARQAANVTRHSSLVSKLLSERDASGRIPFHPYKKWNGAHWTLSILADLGYPAGDESLRPMMEQSFDWLLSEAHKKHIRVIDGRVRRCASQEGNAVWYSLRLGLADSRTDELAERLMKWQWPDGGWNCDKRPVATNSSFMESLIPLRALALYAKVSGDPRASKAAERAAGIFLKRRLFKRQSDGQVMDGHFTRLCYPYYWHYNILFGLVVMAEAGFIRQPRLAPSIVEGCKDALDLLTSKRLPDGGFPAEATYTRTNRPDLSGYSLVNYGGTSKKRLNHFVTADALYVLRLAGRI
ncbi:MAG: hypothetical protein QMD04_02620 [Anaerolineales bacterium]|nr:hypothetical protein [Anaerolineales bacterium]